jgi:hypothetical protein
VAAVSKLRRASTSVDTYPGTILKREKRGGRRKKGVIYIYVCVCVYRERKRVEGQEKQLKIVKVP